MTFRILLLAAGLILFSGGFAVADAPDLEPGVNLKDGGQDLEVQYCSVPCVTDWNNDGAKDLIVGQFTQGYIWLYLNQGTDLNPVFNGRALVESAGQPITTSYG